MTWSQLCSWAAFLFRRRLHPVLIKLLLIHATQILLSLKPISYVHYIYNICTKPTTEAKGMLYGKLEILLFTEILPLCNFSFHFLMVFADLYVKMDTQIRCSDSGNLNFWLKSELNQFTPPRDLMLALYCSKAFFSLRPMFRACSVTMCRCKDSLVARNREGIRNKQQDQRNL